MPRTVWNHEQCKRRNLYLCGSFSAVLSPTTSPTWSLTTVPSTQEEQEQNGVEIDVDFRSAVVLVLLGLVLTLLVIAIIAERTVSFRYYQNKKVCFDEMSGAREYSI